MVLGDKMKEKEKEDVAPAPKVRKGDGLNALL